MTRCTLPRRILKVSHYGLASPVRFALDRVAQPATRDGTPRNAPARRRSHDEDRRWLEWRRPPLRCSSDTPSGTLPVGSPRARACSLGSLALGAWLGVTVDPTKMAVYTQPRKYAAPIQFCAWSGYTMIVIRTTHLSVGTAKTRTYICNSIGHARSTRRLINSLVPPSRSGCAAGVAAMNGTLMHRSQ